MHAFPCGTLPLDFVGTLRARSTDAPTELLPSPDALDAWFVESGLLAHAPGADAADLAHAIELRETIAALVYARAAAAPLPRDAVDALNAAAIEAPLVPRLTPDGWRRQGTPAQALADLARGAVEIIGGEDAALLRECGRPGCTQIYLDRSRGHRREWCSMQTCGARVKAAAYRARKRDGVPV
ncbi:CGNR zinc finger domain-containing protein [Agromyces seonyuensis]|uniref:Zinc finger CGNR domain-containing protein n=1 Tax=Agromyces seonyuensis TaxID=2662446 RepID=A0A6I4NXJ0_9MICO|nr:ABATE domain-containing protein [Agromyces seonyuensis]MWB97235.1 hypothetical protein [Agromyces seonyuensis]